MKDRLYFYDAAGDLIVAPEHQTSGKAKDNGERPERAERDAETSSRPPEASEPARAQAA